MHSIRHLAFLILLIGINAAARAEDRSIDGTGNRLTRPTQGSANTPFIRFGYRPRFFGVDGGMPSETQLPNARTISNAVAAQSSSRPSARNLSNFIWAWGQLLTHDTDLSTTSNGPAVNGTAPIPVHAVGDPLGPNSIPFTRANFVGSLIGIGDRTPINEVTSYIDASSVYGSSAVRAAALRTDGGTGAKLLTSSGNLLPFNSAGLPNENNGPVPANQLFLAGDIRSNENSLLTSLHTVFMREHNRLVDVITAQQPGLDAEQQYQLARKIVGAEMQAITYREFLPALLGRDSILLKAEDYQYTGIDASITTAYSHAAFRLGHSAVTSRLELAAADGASAGDFGVRDVFFNPQLISANPTIVNQLLLGAARQTSEEIDTLVVDDLRQFLFGPPGAGGLDLASLNIQRGRDAGLPSLANLRRAYGAGSVDSFNQLTSDPVLAETLATLYTSVGSMDAWVGGLAEDHVPGASVGEFFKAVIESQFRRLRDGDRLFYRANDAGLYTDGVLNPEIAAIIDLDHIQLSDLLQANTGLTSFQQNVFFIPGTGDFNGDGHVDTADYTVWRDNMGQTGEGLLADADHNGKVDAADYTLWKLLYGSTYSLAAGNGSVTSIPEPASIAFLPVVFMMMLSTRSRKETEHG